MRKHTKQKGFTLIETMVAITILVVAVSAPLTLASQSLFAAVYAKDQTTAFYLAQEAIEIVRNKRDHNMLKFLDGQASVGWLDDILTNTNFLIDVPNDTMVACSAPCLDSKLLHNGAFYNYQSGDTTRFARRVVVIPTAGFENEALITVTVQWKTGSFKERSFALQERIYNWVPEQE